MPASAGCGRAPTSWPFPSRGRPRSSARPSCRSRRRGGRPAPWAPPSRGSSISSPAMPACTWWATTTAIDARPASCTPVRWRCSGACMRARPGPSTSGEEERGAGDAPHRAGFVSLIGRPNVGKSTLLNRLLGQKLAIVSPKPQTTRNRIRGILTRPGVQVVYVDTPGLHPPRGKLGRFMADTAAQALEDVDAVPRAGEGTAPPGLDGAVLDALRTVSAPVVLALNKVDRVADRRRLLPLLEAYAGLRSFHALVPLSAADGRGVDRLEAI